MKIIHLLSNKTWGETEDMVLGLARYQVAEGHDVEVMTKDVSAITGPFRRAGIRITTAPMRGGVDVLGPIRLSKMLRLADGRAVIHVHKFGDAVIASRGRSLAGAENAKVVLSRHIYSPGVDSIAGSSIYSEVDAVVFPDNFARRQFEKGAPKIDKSRLHTIATAVAMPRSISGPQPVRDSSETTILISGPLTYEKGLDTLVKALAKLKAVNFRAIVIGEGIGQTVMPIIRDARRFGIGGRMDWRGAKASLHTAADEAHLAVAPDRFTVHPGNEILTYLSHGLPVIASDNEFHRELASSNPAIRLFKEGDADSLASAIEEVVSNKPQQVNAASFGDFATEIFNLYRSLF